jgi:hypothetical protein
LHKARFTGVQAEIGDKVQRKSGTESRGKAWISTNAGRTIIKSPIRSRYFILCTNSSYISPFPQFLESNLIRQRRLPQKPLLNVLSKRNRQSGTKTVRSLSIYNLQRMHNHCSGSHQRQTPLNPPMKGDTEIISKIMQYRNTLAQRNSQLRIESSSPPGYRSNLIIESSCCPQRPDLQPHRPHDRLSTLFRRLVLSPHLQPTEATHNFTSHMQSQGMNPRLCPLEATYDATKNETISPPRTPSSLSLMTYT